MRYYIPGHQNFNCGIFDFFLKRGCDINLQNIEGYTPLFEYLSKNDNVDNFDLLLESGADPNLSQEKCDSPLMIAIERHWNNERLTTSLVNRVNVNHRAPSDTTALHVALAQGIYTYNRITAQSLARAHTHTHTRTRTHTHTHTMFPVKAKSAKNLRQHMVAYFCDHLSDNYVDLSDLYVDLSDHYVVWSEKKHYNYKPKICFYSVLMPLTATYLSI